MFLASTGCYHSIHATHFLSGIHTLYLVSHYDICGYWGMVRVQTGVTEFGVVGSLAGVISVTESTVKHSLKGSKCDQT